MPLLMRLQRPGKPWPFQDEIDQASIIGYTLSGVSRDSTGAVLASATVKLYRTRDDSVVAAIMSDGSGNYSFPNVSLYETYYMVAYKTGVPDVAGTTLNTLVGV